MNSNLDKILDIVKVGTGVAGAIPVIPGAAVFTKVSEILDSHNDKASGASSDALKHLADENDQQDAAIIAMATAISDLQSRCKKAGI